MSLAVPPALLAAAERGAVDDAAFLVCVRDSLPYVWRVVSTLVVQLHVDGGECAVNERRPPDDCAQGQLLRAMASDAVRGCLERHFEMRLAFQNCHRLAVFRRDAVDGQAYREFVSTRAALLNQAPRLRSC
jgi:hypothetical protein